MKKVLALLLSVCLVVTLIPAISYGADDQTTGNDQGQNAAQELQTEPQEGDDVLGPQDPETPGQGVDGVSGAGGSDGVSPSADSSGGNNLEEPDQTGKDGQVLQQAPGKDEVNGEGSEPALTKGGEGTRATSGQWNYDETAGKWQYLENGTPVKGLKPNLDMGKTYLFDDVDGFMLTGMQSWDGKTYYFDPNGESPTDTDLGARKSGWVTFPNNIKRYFNPDMKTGWVTVNGSKYYLNPSNGVMQTGWLTLSGKKYYLDQRTGVMKTSWLTLNGKKYYFTPSNGVMKTGWLTLDGYKYHFSTKTGEMQTGLQTIDNNKYYFNTTTGVMKTGWQMINGKKHYFDLSTGKMKIGWATINNNKYYFNTDGSVKTGWATISGAKYYFNASGTMRKGWLTLSNNKYYLDLNSGKMKTGWATINGKKYYFVPSSGVMKKGWLTVGSTKYYLDPNSGVMRTKWQTISKKKYYFDAKTGAMKKGWLTLSGKKYYMNTKTGVITKGWLKVSGHKYYMNTKTGVMTKGLRKISGTYYYFKTNGVMMKNDYVKLSGKLYYFQNSGKARMKKGWFKCSDGNKRYSKGNGIVMTGMQKISGTWYSFSKVSGVLLRTIGDDIDKKVQSKSSNTSYLVVVNRAKYHVRIYKGSKNNWTRTKKFDCAIGTASAPTPAGTYSITKKGTYNKYAVNGVQACYYYYCYYFNKKQGIHSGLYYEGTGTPGQAYDTRVNVRSTNGGVRVNYGNAQWIYNNIPVGTKVVVY